MSACETGLGDVRTGQGIYGLRRAIVLAGVQSQVVSLWQVDDDATKDLMVNFYKRLAQGEGRAEALRKVKLEMTRGDRVHPYYWASFILSGDWRPMTSSVFDPKREQELEEKLALPPGSGGCACRQGAPFEENSAWPWVLALGLAAGVLWRRRKVHGTGSF